MCLFVVDDDDDDILTPSRDLSAEASHFCQVYFPFLSFPFLSILCSSLPYRWAMLGVVGALIPEAFGLGIWWKVGAAKASGEDLNYLGIPGLQIAGAQGTHLAWTNFTFPLSSLNVYVTCLRFIICRNTYHRAGAVSFNGGSGIRTFCWNQGS